VVVERVLPEIDGGRFPVKRTVGALLGVTAWIHADGHDAIAAVLRYRPVSQRGRHTSWVERPMHPRGNDEWVASFVVERHCDYEYTVEAWVSGQTDRTAMATHAPARAAYGRTLRVSVDRPRAQYGAWYEMFPRSWGPDPTRSATFHEASAFLPRIAAMGFDVVYLPPIHPIGTTHRKGRGNAIGAAPGDPGSPWAIGSDAGGHKAVEPGLGTLEDFDDFVEAARRLGLELALDVAFQCSPDHPYVREHPEWFRHRPDGTIQYAENPPKKYQDIYPFDFEGEAWSSLWDELKSIVTFWAARGVRIFRVDNPHTKPYAFWEWLIREVRSEYPDVIFLAEAFTRPKVMSYLAKLGFNQSYTYFTWRNTKDELTEYFTELTQTEVAQFFRPNLFANTPDILHAYLQQGGTTAFKIRLLLASMLGASYGIYSGFELCENRAVPGTEEYAGSEKYQYRHWDLDRPDAITDLVAAVNQIRRDHPALHSNDSLTFCSTDNPQLIAFYKVSPPRSDAILVIINLDGRSMQQGWVDVPVDTVGLPHGDAYEVVDLLAGQRYTWRGSRNYVRLDPAHQVAHVLQLPIASPVEALTGDALAAYLPGQRWFAGKSRAAASVRLLDVPAESQAGPLIPAVVGVEYADGGTERYFVPLTAASGPGAGETGAIARTGSVAIADALDNDEACRALAVVMREARTLRMRHGVARSRVFSGASFGEDLPIVRSTVEQSNSSFRLGDACVIKVIRRLESGPHPEIEMLRCLARRGFEHAPAPLASLEYEPAGEETTTLAVAQAFVPNEGTVWTPAIADAQAFIEGTGRTREARTTAFIESAAALGQTTAALHRALAEGDDDPAFTREPFTEAAAVDMLTRLRAAAARLPSLLVSRLDSMTVAVRTAAEQVIARLATIEARLSTAPVLTTDAARIRVHGDYHLGQILATRAGFVVIDFEGEPARPLADRRSKQSPLKDIAGMLRSFGYAAHMASIAGNEPRRAPSSERRDQANTWEAAVTSAFLAAYRDAVKGAGLVPSADAGFEGLLDLFVLDKALYEVEYELASRPDWAIIPLLGILRIVDAPAPAETS
jgi:starch synthase (maltosyl-transferring)